MKGFYPKRPVKSFLDLAVVYLEQYRDIYNTGIETEFFEEQIKGLVGLRQKTLYLQRSWRKFITGTTP